MRAAPLMTPLVRLRASSGLFFGLLLATYLSVPSSCWHARAGSVGERRAPAVRRQGGDESELRLAIGGEVLDGRGVRVNTTLSYEPYWYA